MTSFQTDKMCFFFFNFSPVLFVSALSLVTPVLFPGVSLSSLRFSGWIAQELISIDYLDLITLPTPKIDCFGCFIYPCSSGSIILVFRDNMLNLIEYAQGLQT